MRFLSLVNVVLYFNFIENSRKMPKPLVAKASYLEKHLIIKKSEIPKSGKGLFTKINIEKDDIIAEYTGEKVSHTIGTSRILLGLSNSIIYLNKKYLIDSTTDKNCKTTFINDASGPSKINKKNNVYMIQVNGRIYVVAKRNIKKGEELLIGYGKRYWDK